MTDKMTIEERAKKVVNDFKWIMTPTDGHLSEMIKQALINERRIALDGVAWEQLYKIRGDIQNDSKIMTYNKLDKWLYENDTRPSHDNMIQERNGG